jgi:hypothetical protein
VLCIRLKRFLYFIQIILIFVGQTACRQFLSVKRPVGKKAVGRMAVGEMAVGKKAVTGTPTEVLLDIRFQLIG